MEGRRPFFSRDTFSTFFPPLLSYRPREILCRDHANFSEQRPQPQANDEPPFNAPSGGRPCSSARAIRPAALRPDLHRTLPHLLPPRRRSRGLLAARPAMSVGQLRPVMSMNAPFANEVAEPSLRRGDALHASGRLLQVAGDGAGAFFAAHGLYIDRRCPGNARRWVLNSSECLPLTEGTVFPASSAANNNNTTIKYYRRDDAAGVDGEGSRRRRGNEGERRGGATTD